MLKTEENKYDIIVCGGGCAGFCAAVAAGRLGNQVALIEKYYTPGGILTVLGNNSIDRFNNPFKKSKKMIIAGIGWEFVMRLYRDGFAAIPNMSAAYQSHDQYGVKVNPVAAAKTMDDMLIEAGVKLYYGQPVVEAITENATLQSITIYTKSGLKKLYADIFIDCTGDGELAYFAGAETCAGDEKGNFQPGTLRFYPATDANDYILNYGDNQNHVSMDVTDSDSLTQSEIASRKMIYKNMKEHGEKIMAVAPAVAPREGRRITGITQMSRKDYCSGTIFDDSICYSHWFIDIHRDHQPAYIQYIKSENTPTIRLTSMISRNISNLMMAGRCISSDRETNSAIRVKASCMAMGQAVGTAASVAIKENTTVKNVPISIVKDSLKEQGAIVPGISDGMEWDASNFDYH